MTQELTVGVDIHRQQNVFSVMDGEGEELTSAFACDNNQPGTQAAVGQIAGLMAAGGYDQVRIAAEATGWYWFPFFLALSHSPMLNQWPLTLYAFNPRLTANYKKSFSDLDKTDDIDAYVVADRLRINRDLPAPFTYDPVALPLRMLTRYRYHVVHDLAREKSYCLNILYLKASEYTRRERKPFSDVFGAASKAVLQEFTSLEEVAAIPFDDLVEFIDVKGKRRFPDPSQNARRLQRVAEDSYPVPPELLATLNLILGMSFQRIAQLEQLQKRLNTAITQQMISLPHTLDSIPGIGSVFSAGILAEIGNLERFDYDQAKVANFAGFKWRKTQSADFIADESPMTRKGNPYLRYYFCEAANIVRMHDAEYKAFYQRKFKEVRKHQHKRALVLTARKLVRLVVRLLTTNQPYRPRRIHA
jgi:transposase